VDHLVHGNAAWHPAHHAPVAFRPATAKPCPRGRWAPTVRGRGTTRWWPGG